MTTELVTTHSPEDLLALWSYLDLCEASLDAFYEDYASALSPETDKNYPRATNIRPHILEAFDAVRDIKRLATGLGGFGHEYARLPGKVEHALYSGFRHSFVARTKIECTLNQIEQTLTDMEKQFDPRDWDNDASQLASVNEAKSRCLTALRNAEVELDESEKQYFRLQLLDYARALLRIEIP